MSEFYVTFAKETNLNTMSTEEYFKNRRTIRKYLDKDVPQSLINELLLKASHAPTTGNMQLYSVVETRDADARRRLAPMHFNQPQVTDAPVVLTFCADCNRFTCWCKASCADAGYDNFQSFMAAALDTIAFAQQFNTLAELAGLGVCWLGTTTYNAQEIARELKLPELVVPMITLTVGYPAEEGTETGRLPLEALMHEGKYHDYSDDRIRSLYHEKEERADSKQFIKENQKETLAQVFTDIRYPRSNNEAFSVKFIDFLKNSGFLK